MLVAVPLERATLVDVTPSLRKKFPDSVEPSPTTSIDVSLIDPTDGEELIAIRKVSTPSGLSNPSVSSPLPLALMPKEVPVALIVPELPFTKAVNEKIRL